MLKNYRATKDIAAFNFAVNQLRAFFLERGFTECHTQDRLSILAACEDPTTIATFDYVGQKWPLPQTGQMWLEYELLTNPQLPGVFCVSTSYRQEKNPIPGRHELIFPMFEFESRGTLDDLRQLETDLCEYLGFGSRESFIYQTYKDLANYYGVEELKSEHELRMQHDFSPVVFLERFPENTSPFWNMARDGKYAHKIDVILCGAETIGSAERSTNPTEMRERFYAISDGQYAETLFTHFG